jgi:hypothetical protein
MPSELGGPSPDIGTAIADSRLRITFPAADCRTIALPVWLLLRGYCGRIRCNAATVARYDEPAWLEDEC